MFDFRYHALSLVAVFLALMIGLLLGVAIGDQGLVSSAEQNVRDSLRKDVRDARAESAGLRKELAERRRFEQAVYPLLVDDRLAGQRIGLIGMGGLPDGAIRAVRRALENTGGRLSAVGIVREPVAADLVPPAPPRRGAPAGAPDEAAFRRFGATIGARLVRGREDARVRRSLFESSSGKLEGLTAVVLVRAARDEKAAAAAQTGAFELGFVDGLVDTGAQVVGAELTSSEPSQIAWFKDRRVPSVDSIDELAGRAALVFALAGANGAFGVKDSAEALLPTAAGGTGP